MMKLGAACSHTKTPIQQGVFFFLFNKRDESLGDVMVYIYRAGGGRKVLVWY